jgi:purine-binding chemotaxis protein CheW
MTMADIRPVQAETNGVNEFVTLTLGQQLFGIPIERVRDVFVPERVTRVPLAPPEIAGVLNLRGRIVTGIDLRARLGTQTASSPAPLALGIECKNECYALLTDAVGDVVRLAKQDWEANPINLDPALALVSDGIYRLPGQILLVLDVDRLLGLENGETEPPSERI